MKRFILFNSPIFWNSTKEQEEYLSPLGLGYIATYLEKAGVKVQLVDCVKEKRSVKDIIELIDIERPDCIGINVFTQNYEIVKYIIENINIKCECFIGGQAVKSLYSEILQWDTENKLNIVIGEGEFITPALVLDYCVQKAEIRKGFKYVYRVNNDSEYFPKDISNIFLDRKFLKNEVINNHYGEKEAAIITSRGCMFDCAFCGGARSLNRDITIRTRTENSVINEIEEILSVHSDVKSIRILDDLFLRNSNSIDVANSIFKKFPQLSWRGMAHVLSFVQNLNKIEELRIGNCKELFVGIESGSQRIREKINKLGTSQQIETVAQEILKNGIDLKGYFIYGFPGENKQDFQETYELAVRLKDISYKTKGKFRSSVFQFRPYHGTQLYREIKQKNGIIHGCKFNQAISQFQGRSQFNFEFGNYSEEPDAVLNEYIIRTQKLTEERND